MMVTLYGLLLTLAILVAVGTCGLWFLTAFAAGMSSSPYASREAMADAKVMFWSGMGIAAVLGSLAWLFR